MLLSGSHKFIFIHNYKVAGTSIRHALKGYATSPIEFAGWLQRQLARLRLRSVPSCPDHAPACAIRRRYPRRWDEYFTFGFVRNPWAWQVSLYAYMRQNEQHASHALIRSMSGFDEYLEWRVRHAKVTQSSFFTDADGNFIVDFVGRLECLQSHFQQVCDRIGVNATLPRRNSSRHRDYRDYYDERARRLVEKHFAEDIDRFRYSFSDSPEADPVLLSR